jgi:hypothetical protein
VYAGHVHDPRSQPAGRTFPPRPTLVERDNGYDNGHSTRVTSPPSPEFRSRRSQRESPDESDRRTLSPILSPFPRHQAKGTRRSRKATCCPSLVPGSGTDGAVFVDERPDPAGSTLVITSRVCGLQFTGCILDPSGLKWTTDDGAGGPSRSELTFPGRRGGRAQLPSACPGACLRASHQPPRTTLQCTGPGQCFRQSAGKTSNPVHAVTRHPRLINSRTPGMASRRNELLPGLLQAPGKNSSSRANAESTVGRSRPATSKFGERRVEAWQGTAPGAVRATTDRPGELRGSAAGLTRRRTSALPSAPAPEPPNSEFLPVGEGNSFSARRGVPAAGGDAARPMTRFCPRCSGVPGNSVAR